MLDQSSFSVNVCADNGKEWTQYFPLKEQAGLYIRIVDGNAGGSVTGLTVIEHNFEMPSDAELDAFLKLETRATENARRLEQWARRRSNANFDNPSLFPCEICGEAHGNFECCESCNRNRHWCHFCGDELGHKEFSVCYIMHNWEENYVRLSNAG